MNLFIVKDKTTGKYLPPIRGGKSSTAQALGDKPRTFTTRHAAENAARWWAEGMHTRQYDDDDYAQTVYPVKGRDLSTLRVYKLSCTTLLYAEKIRPVGGNK